jgi:predicted ATP-dependent serine protease
MVAHIAESRRSDIIYLSGKETADQIASRVDRLCVNVKGIYLTNEIDTDRKMMSLRRDSAICAAICTSRVLFPIPGSPASSMTLSAINPPPRTRLSSSLKS